MRRDEEYELQNHAAARLCRRDIDFNRILIKNLVATTSCNIDN